jgi:hypothetical protein
MSVLGVLSDISNMSIDEDEDEDEACPGKSDFLRYWNPVPGIATIYSRGRPTTYHGIEDAINAYCSEVGYSCIDLVMELLEDYPTDETLLRLSEDWAS